MVAGKKARINDKTLEAMKDSNAFKGRMCADFDKSYDTVQRWLNTNDIVLTTIDALSILHDVLSIESKDAIEFI